jgi:hypothetical protein
MTDGDWSLDWLLDNWPWWVVAFFLVSYEISALITRGPTLSRMVWRSTTRYPWMPYIVFTLLGILIPHFWIPGAAGWVWAGIFVALVWIVYFTLRKAR